MNVNLIVLIISVIFLLFLSGCTDQKISIEDRLACINLTSKSYAVIPSCNSIEECFSRVDSSFDFPQEHFSPRVNQKIFSYKNSLSQSWLYYNHSLKSIKSVHEICVSEKNIPQIPHHLNELSNHLTHAFNHANQANKQSFSILLLEKQVMLEEEIDLIKEENLYSDFVLIQSNLNEFSENSPPNSDSYFSHYYSVLQEFNSLSERFGFQPVITEETTLIDLLDASDETLLKDSKKKNQPIYIPLLSNFISKAITQLNNLLKLEQSVSILQSMPSFEFIQTYSKLTGETNSVSSHFISTLKQIALNRNSIAERNSATFSEISSLSLTAQGKINQFSEKTFGEFDSHFLNELYSLLDENQISFSSNSFKVSQLSEIHSIAQNQLDSLNLNLSALTHKIQTQKIPLGEKTSELKFLKNSLLELNSNLDFLKNNSLDSLLSLCNKKIQLIKQQLPKNTKTQNTVQRITYSITQFNSSPEITASLWHCKNIVTEFNSLQKMLKNKQAYENDLNSRSQECFHFLEKIFSNPSTPQSILQYKNPWLELLKEKNSFPSTETISNKCSLLKQQIETTLNQSLNASPLKETFHKTKNHLTKLNSLNSFYPELFKKNELTNLQKEFNELQTHFPENKLDWSNSLPEFPEIKQKTQTLENTLQETLKEKLIEFLKKTAKKHLYHSTIPELNQDQNFLTKISFQNPFQEFTHPLTFSLPFHSNNTKTLTNKSPNISRASFSENKILLELNSLPKGETLLEFHSTQKITSKNTTELVSISPEKALFKKTLTIDSNFFLPKLKIQTQLETFNCSIAKAFIYSQEKQIPHTLKNNQITFYTEDIFPQKKIEIYYELKNPLQISISFKNSTPLDNNTTLLKYSFTLKNKLPHPLKNTKLALPLNLEKESIYSITSFDSLGNEFSTKIEFNKPTIEIPLLQSNSSIEGELWIKVNNLSLFWKNLVKEAETKLSEIPTTSPKTQKESSEISKKLSSLKEFPFSEKNLKELQDLEKQTLSLEEKETQTTKTIEEFLSLKKQAKTKLDELSKAKEFFNLESNPAFQESFEKYSEAEKLFSEKKYSEALLLLSESLNPIQSEPLSQLKDSFLKNLSEKTQETEQTHTALKNLSITSTELENKKQKIFSLEETIRESLAKDSYSNLKNQFQEFNSTLNSFNSAKETATKERITQIKTKINSFLELLEEPPEFPLLEKELSSVSEEQLIKAKYLLPIQKKEFENFKNHFTKTKNSPLTKSLKEILQKLDSNQQIEALQEFAKIEEKLQTTSQKLSEQKQTALNAYTNLKTDAVSAIQTFSQANLSQELLPHYNKALEEFEENNLLKTITITGMLSLIEGPQTPESFLPTAIIPIIIAIAFLLIAKKKRKKKIEKKKIVPSVFLTHSFLCP